MLFLAIKRIWRKDIFAIFDIYGIEENPLRTLFNLSEDLIEKFLNSSSQWKSFDLNPRGIQLIREYMVPSIDELGNNSFRVYPKIFFKKK